MPLGYVMDESDVVDHTYLLSFFLSLASSILDNVSHRMLLPLKTRLKKSVKNSLNLSEVRVHQSRQRHLRRGKSENVCDGWRKQRKKCKRKCERKREEKDCRFCLDEISMNTRKICSAKWMRMKIWQIQKMIQMGMM